LAFQRKHALEIVIGAALYFIAAQVGLEMAFVADQVSVIWPATGVGLALLVLRGRHLWPAIALGAFTAQLSSGAPLTAAVGIAIGSTLEAILGAELLARVDFSAALKRVRDVASLFLVAAALTPIVSATVGVTSLCLAGVEPWSTYRVLWSVWWIGDAVGDVVFAPMIFVWADQLRRGWQLERLGEAFVLALALLILSLAVFAEGSAQTRYPVHYLVIPAVIWSALRLGQHATATLIFGAFSVTVIATLGGRGPFVAQSMNASLLDVELFIAVVSVTGLFLGAAMAERNRAERRRAIDYSRLRRSEERLAMALAAGHMGAWEWNIERGSVEWSDTVAAIHGLAPGSFRGTFDAFRELVHPDDRERVLEMIRQAIARATEYSVEFRNMWPDGSIHWIAMSGQVICDRGRPVRIVGVCRDITEHKGINDALTRQAQQLAEADRRKDEFLAVLGHELRNPLAPLQNSVALLAHRASDPGVVAQARSVMQRQLRHLVRLVDDLLDVSRIRSGKIVLAKQPLELALAVNSAVELSKPGIDARRHRLVVSLPPEPVWLHADPTRLPQLLANLLNNAAKYTDEGGQIDVIAERSGSSVIVRIRDTGIGMNAQDLTGVFELFAQAGGSSQHSVQGGLGVGLSLARSLAELHGGTLAAHSEGIGRGSEFVLRLPAASSPSAAAAAKNGGVMEMPPGITAQRIVVVDDNVDAAESLSLLLAQDGHEVRVAHRGTDALNIARNFIPQVMILDLGMPEMDGYAVARAARADPALANIRLIALSGYGQPEDRRRTAEAGFDAHLVKPVEPDQLNAVLAPNKPTERTDNVMRGERLGAVRMD
jgi:PAS domain S-box-containing protein